MFLQHNSRLLTYGSMLIPILMVNGAHGRDEDNAFFNRVALRCEAQCALAFGVNF